MKQNYRIWNFTLIVLNSFISSAKPNLTSFEKFQLRIRKQSMYRESDGILEDLLRAMAKEDIVHLEQKEGGTQLKLIMDFESNGQAMFKPMRSAI